MSITGRHEHLRIGSTARTLTFFPAPQANLALRFFLSFLFMTAQSMSEDNTLQG